MLLSRTSTSVSSHKCGKLVYMLPPLELTILAGAHKDALLAGRLNWMKITRDEASVGLFTFPLCITRTSIGHFIEL